MKYRQGDLLNDGLEAWGHGVNLDGVMGSGIARQVRSEYPEVYEQYRLACSAGHLKPGGFQAVEADNGSRVYNLVSQIQQGPNAKYELLVSSVIGAMSDMKDVGIEEFGLPLIGCGIGGLKWEKVEGYLNSIQTIFPTTEIVVYTL